MGVEPQVAGRVALITLGCARNEVDSEELAGLLADDGFELVPAAADADLVLVNTCGFIEAAKRESIEVLLDATTASGDADSTGAVPGPKVVAVGCMAERYGTALAAELPEAAVLGFDDYPHIGERLRTVLAGGTITAHEPRDRRALLPMAPTERVGSSVHIPGHASPHGRELPPGSATEATVGPGWIRRKVAAGPVAALKIASGCDRRCAFCAIPSFRGSFVSRPSEDLLAEARWLVEQGIREVHLVSENSTSYGKDFGSGTALDALLEELDRVDGLRRVRVAYLQPAEVRPGLVSAMVRLPIVADYFDLSFQHASPTLLRRMRRFGGAEDFLALIASVRAQSPQAGLRSNVILGFPGETAQDVTLLLDFLAEAQLDAVGVFGYSDEEGTEGFALPGKLDPAEIRARVDEVSSVLDELMADRARARLGQEVEVLVERVDGSVVEGRAAHQGPEDGLTTMHVGTELAAVVVPGSLLRGRIESTDGVDLHATEVSLVRA